MEKQISCNNKMAYYLVIKNELLIYATICVNLTQYYAEWKKQMQSSRTDKTNLYW